MCLGEIGGKNIKYNEKMCSKFLVMAPMSSGKSTFVNALLGKRVLQTSNFACTSNCFKVVINQRLSSSCIYLEQDNGDMQQTYKEIIVETSSINSNVSSKPIILVDTPGENYSQNTQHKMLAKRALDEFDNGMVIYILNATQIGTEDDYRILSEVKAGATTKNIKILFVLNKIDELDSEREKVNDFIDNVVIPFIKQVGVSDFMIIPCAAEAALLFKCAIRGEFLSETESDKLYRYFRIYSKNKNSNKLSTFGSYKITKKNVSKVIYDGEEYDALDLKNALRNTGIYEVETYISKETV